MGKTAVRPLIAGLASALAATALIGGPASAQYGPPEAELPYDEELVIGTVTQRPLEPGEGRLMKEAGIESVRIWLAWNAVESERGEYDWRQTDAAVRELAERELTPAPFLFGTPTWAAKDDDRECDGDECVAYPPVSSETLEAFARFCAAAVRRYGPDGGFWKEHPALPERPIEVWQVWNEPNLAVFFRPAVDAGAYANLVRAAGRAIHGEDSDAEVLLAGLSGTRSTDRQVSSKLFLRQFYGVAGIAESFEGIGLHPYHPQTRGVIRQIELIHRIVSGRDAAADLWITEIGWASSGKSKSALVKTPRGQARMLRRVFGRLIRRGDEWDLRGVYWYAWRDTERGKAVCAWCGGSGLRDREGDAKPAYEELRRLTSSDSR